MLDETCENKELCAEYLTQRVEQKRKNYLKKELEALGYKVIVSRGDAPSPDAGRSISKGDLYWPAVIKAARDRT